MTPVQSVSETTTTYNGESSHLLMDHKANVSSIVCYCRLQPPLLLERHILQLQKDGAVLKHRHACKERRQAGPSCSFTVTISISLEHTAAICTMTRPP